MIKSGQGLIRQIYQSQYSSNYFIIGPFGKRYITYSDYIASGQPLKIIEEFIQSSVLPTYANTHTEASFTGLQTSHFREEARNFIKESVNASENDKLIFTGAGSTAAIDLMNRRLIQFYEKEKIKPVIFIGPYEHHSNILPWREGPFDLVEVPIAADGNVDVVYLEEQLKKYQGKRPMIGSFSAASNVTGILAPVEKITSLLKAYDALSFWDYAGAAPYVKIDMNPKGGVALDAIFISTHKLIGGPGTPGLLIVKKELFEGGLPIVTGGGTVHFVTKKDQYYLDNIEEREEGGTPAIIESIRAGLAFKLKDMVGAKTIEAVEHDYITKAIKRLKKHPDVYVLGDLDAPRLGFMAFHIKHKGKFLHHNFVVALLNDLFGIQSRGGCSCAGPYGHDLLSLDDEKSKLYMTELETGNTGIKPGWVRLNFNYFIPKEEFEFLLDAMIWISEHGWKLLSYYHFDEDLALWVPANGKRMITNSLTNLILDKAKLKKGTAIGKKRARKTYFNKANQLVKKSISLNGKTKLQDYKFNQIGNELRWYLIAQDVV